MNDTAPPVASRADFQTAVRWAIAQAIAGGTRRITAVDPTFADWPLDAADLHHELTAWLKLPQRKLVLLAAHYDDVRRRHPRFVAWRALWAHAIDCHAPAEGELPELPTFAVGDGAVVLQLFDRVHWRGRAGRDAADAQRLREQTDALLQRSEPAFAVNCLGL